MTKAGQRAILSIPNHDVVKRRTLQVLIQAADLTEREYLDCFEKKTAKRPKK